ncbi:sugar transferase [Marinilabiliaceae bacterium JC017]|nr:sugar transferase [Marinilabiliaceae bacterium JC017]
MTAPIALFVYNRPVHTLSTLQHLQKNKGAADSCLYIYSDGPKQPKDEGAVNQVREIINRAQGFKSIKVIERQNNFGLARNIIEGVSEILQNHENIIVLEDDLLTSEGFLKYMNTSLSFYKDSRIFSICGYHPPISIPKTYSYSTFLVPRIGSWGWATWREKWLKADWQVKDFNVFIKNKKERLQFEKGGNDTAMMLLSQQTGKNNSWAIRFNYACYKDDGLCAYPTQSLIQNAGIDGSGTHMKKSNKYAASVTQCIDLSNLCPPEVVDEKIQQNFRRFYNTSLFRRTINHLKFWKYIKNITD